MQEKSESLILSEVFEDARSLTKFYLARATGVDPHKVYVVDGKKLNTFYYILGHLVWAEHFLLYEAMTGEKLGIPWLDQFDIDVDAWSESQVMPTMEELLSTMEMVHSKCMETLLLLTDAELDAPNLLGISFRAGNSRRVVIRHAIRHEPYHTGQIGWILKFNGVETV